MRAGPSASIAQALRTASSTVFSAAWSALKPTDEESWSVLADVGRYSCLRCLDGTEPDWVGYRSLILDLVNKPNHNKPGAVTAAAPKPPTILPKALSSAQADLGNYLRVAGMSSGSGVLPAPAFLSRYTKERLLPTSLLTALQASEGRWNAMIKRKGGGGQAASEVTPAPKAALPYLMQQAHLLGPTPTPKPSSSSSAKKPNPAPPLSAPPYSAAVPYSPLPLAQKSGGGGSAASSRKRPAPPPVQSDYESEEKEGEEEQEEEDQVPEEAPPTGGKKTSTTIGGTGHYRIVDGVWKRFDGAVKEPIVQLDVVDVRVEEEEEEEYGRGAPRKKTRSAR